MSLRVLIFFCGLLFCQSGIADWRVITSKNLGNALLKKEIRSNTGNPAIAVMCLPEPTLIVDWLGEKSDISVRIDTVSIDVPKQVAMRNGMHAITLKSAHVRGLINGMQLQLEATLSSGEVVTAEASLVGFTNEFNTANMNCSI